MRKREDQFPLRMPPGLRDRLKRAAVDSRRSMNAELLLAIESWLAKTAPDAMKTTPMQAETPATADA